MIDKQEYREAHNHLRQAKRILLVAHPKPDGDTTGSCLGIYHWLQGLQKHVYLFCVDEVGDSLRFLPNADAFQQDHNLFHFPWDVIVVCDAGDLGYAGIEQYMERLPNMPTIINFDHHHSNTEFGHVNLVDTKASSTAQVVHTFFEHNEIEVNDTMAKCLLTSIFTDTGGFSNAATNHESLSIASDLVRRGASLTEIHRATIANKDINVLKVWGRAFARLKQNDDGIVVTYISHKDTDEHGVEADALEGLSNYLSYLHDAKAVIVYHERADGMIKASMRTYRDDVDLAELAKMFGGGGHKKAAGFTVRGRLVITDDGVDIQKED